LQIIVPEFFSIHKHTTHAVFLFLAFCKKRIDKIRAPLVPFTMQIYTIFSLICVIIQKIQRIFSKNVINEKKYVIYPHCSAKCAEKI